MGKGRGGDERRTARVELLERGESVCHLECNGLLGLSQGGCFKMVVWKVNIWTGKRDGLCRISRHPLLGLADLAP